MKLKFTEKAAKSIVRNGLNRGEELEHLDEETCNIFFQNFRKPSADQNGVVISTMAEVFLKILVWGMKHIRRVSRKIDIETTSIDWCLSMKYQKKLEDAWPNNLSEKYYPKSNLCDFPRLLRI